MYSMLYVRVNGFTYIYTYTFNAITRGRRESLVAFWQNFRLKRADGHNSFDF